MGHRFFRVQGPGTAEGDDLPISVTAVPVEGRLPAVFADGLPAIGKPQQGVPVSTVVDEIQVLPASHQAVHQAVVGEPGLVPGPLVVPGKSLGRGSHLEHPAFQPVKFQGGRCGRLPGSIVIASPIAGSQGIARQDVLDIGDQQLLMLLLVVQSQLHQLRELGKAPPVQIFNYPQQPFVDAGAVAIDLLHRRPRQRPSNVPGNPLSEALVVGVEDEVIPRMISPIVLCKTFQDHALEEPGGVTQMPLGRADVRHGLNHVVLGAEGLTEIPGGLPDRLKSAPQLRSIHGRGG